MDGVKVVFDVYKACQHRNIYRFLGCRNITFVIVKEQPGGQAASNLVAVCLGVDNDK